MEKEAERKTLYEAYTDYIDPSAVIVNNYMKDPFYPGQEKYFQHINQWIENDEGPNRPLVFKTSPGVGVKTILSHWYNQTIEANDSKKQKILPIIHFASSGSNSSNYFYCLYRIVIKLREVLKIKHTVDLLQEKIRKYFAYWLDICSTEVEKQKVICSTDDIYSKIVIVIEAVDKFTDPETGKEANIPFWLPQFFPQNVKVICTVQESSESYEYFDKKGCKIVPITVLNEVSDRLFEQKMAENTILSSDLQKNLKENLKTIYQEIRGNSDVYKMLKMFSQFFLIGPDRCNNSEISNLMKKSVQSRVKKGDIKDIRTIVQLYNIVLDMYGQIPAFKGKLIDILLYLILTQKGITVKQIAQLTKFKEEDWNIFENIFRPLVLKYDKFYSIKYGTFINYLLQREGAGKQTKFTKYNEKIAQALENTFNSIRKLEQQTYHLFVSKSYFKLKEIVSSIENFLLMFNPQNKYELSRYWQKLEEKGFDPVIEYNKAIESFSMHYHPTDENMFKIIVQISRFLKEFCDFETYETPAFRHPFIEGNMVELQKIGLLEELNDLQIYVDNSFNNPDDQDAILSSTLQDQLKLIREKYFPKQKQQQQKQIPVKKSKALEADKQANNGQKSSKKNNPQILSQIEQLNVDVPMNRDKFRNHYLNSLQDYMKSEDFDQSENDTGYFVVEDESDQHIQISRNHPQFSFNKIKENYKLRQIKPSLYYYKRWIWIQFPWVCISLHNNYSNTPEFCKNIECETDNYEEEAKYTKQALIVAIEAKEKKKMMFTKKSEDYNSNYASRNRPMANTTSKFSSARFGDKSSMRSRVVQKTFSSVDLNLNALTKQLEMRKKDMPTDYTKQNDGFFLSEVNQNCQEDMKFISQRKQFITPAIEGVPANQILPKLKWQIKDHTNYQIAFIKTNIEEKKKKLNKIIYQNKKLAETYKQLKLKQNLTKKNMNEQDIDKNSRRNKQLEELSKKKEEVINQFCKSLLQKERLKIILKLCAENKTKNQEYLASLNYFLQNLKKMISWEKNHIKDITTDMNGKRALKEKKEAMLFEKAKNQKIVEKQARNYLQEKQKLQQQIENISVIIADDLRDQKDRLENSLQGHIKNCEQKNIMMMQEKKTKQLEQKLKNLQQQYQALKELFKLEGLEFQQSARFKQLLEQNEKNKKLKIIYFERKTKLEEIKSEHERLKEQIYKKQQNNKNNRDSESRSSYMEVTYKVDDSKEKLKNKLKIILSNMAMKLDVEDTDNLIPVLKKKLEEIREKDPAKYQSLVAPKVLAQ